MGMAAKIWKWELRNVNRSRRTNNNNNNNNFIQVQTSDTKNVYMMFNIQYKCKNYYVYYINFDFREKQ